MDRFDLLIHKGNECARKDDFNSAFRYYLDAHRIEPQFSEPFSKLASLVASKGKYDFACELEIVAIIKLQLRPHNTNEFDTTYKENYIKLGTLIFANSKDTFMKYLSKLTLADVYFSINDPIPSVLNSSSRKKNTPLKEIFEENKFPPLSDLIAFHIQKFFYGFSLYDRIEFQQQNPTLLKQYLDLRRVLHLVGRQFALDAIKSTAKNKVDFANKVTYKIVNSK
jgi:hypothetical protein